MEGTPKRHRANSLVEERSPETPSPSGGRDGARDDDSGISRPSFLPSPRHHQQSGLEHGQRHGHVYGHIQGHGHGHGHTHGNSSGAGFPKLNPQSPGKTVSLMPPETPKSKNQELFLSPSLDLQSPVHKPFTANQKPIREISNNLKSRLNYAYVKMMHHQKKDSTDESTTTTTYTVKPSSYSNVFAQDSDTEPESVSFERKPDTKTGAGAGSGSGHSSGHGSANSLLEPGIELIEENSAQAAFLKALQSPKKKQRSLSSTHPKITRTSSSTDDGPNSQPSEVEAIETLMSLSSPHKRRPSGSFELTLPAPTPPPPSMSVPMSASASAGPIERPIAIPNPGKSEAKLGPGSIISTSEQPKAKTQAKTQAHAQDQSEVLLGSPKLSKPAKLTLHSEVQTDVETDVESQSDD